MDDAMLTNISKISITGSRKVEQILPTLATKDELRTWRSRDQGRNPRSNRAARDQGGAPMPPGDPQRDPHAVASRDMPRQRAREEANASRHLDVSLRQLETTFDHRRARILRIRRVPGRAFAARRVVDYLRAASRAACLFRRCRSRESCPGPVPVLVALWTVPAGIRNVPPALSVTGALPSCSTRNVPSRT